MTSAAASTHPYLVRAIHEWCLDGGFTPYIVVRVDGDVLVPPGYANDGQIVLNLDPSATNRLSFSPEGIGFQARFGGVAHDLWVPYGNLLAIYARENGRGLAFSQGVAFELHPEGQDAVEEPDDEPVVEASTPPAAPAASADEEPPRAGGRGGHLKVIK
ncbi:MAG: ClpXP protease specificity-enhancing factor [Pseudazoarcus pumilus]|nr:ClpXP protease specificity-enhancing factor [Pseudazoarcus pumilus]